MREPYNAWESWRVRTARNGALEQSMALFLMLLDLPYGLKVEPGTLPGGLHFERGHHRYHVKVGLNLFGHLCGSIDWSYPTPGSGYSSHTERWWARHATPKSVCARLALWLEWQDTYGRPALAWEDRRASHADQ